MTPYSQLRTSEPRINLAEAIPLPAPLSLFVEPTNVCNMKCSFCPESFPDYSTSAGYYQKMDKNTWDLLADQLLTWGITPKALRFYGLGEPLLNPLTPAMMRESILWGIADRIELTTNGSLLGLRAEEIIRSGLDYLRVSVYGTTNEQYRQVTGSRYTADDIRQSVATFHTLRKRMGRDKPHIAIQYTTSNGDAEELHRQYDGIADDVFVEPVHNWGSSDGRLIQLGASLKTEKQVCPKPFYELVVKANGDVSCCCVDWDGQLAIGNILKNSLKEIWEGQLLREIQQVHLAGERSKLVSCRDCTFIYKQPDDLDSLVNK